MAWLGAIFNSASALYPASEPKDVLGGLSNIILFNMHTTILQTGSSGENQGHTARALTAEIQTSFPATLQHQVLVLTTKLPAHTMQWVRGGGLLGNLCILLVSQRFTGQRECPANLPPSTGSQYLVQGRSYCYILGQTAPCGRRIWVGRSHSHPQCHLLPCGHRHQDSKSTGSHCGVSWDKIPQCPHTEVIGPWSRDWGLGAPRER